MQICHILLVQSSAGEHLEEAHLLAAAEVFRFMFHITQNFISVSFYYDTIVVSDNNLTFCSS